jgi:hypothetical protein
MVMVEIKAVRGSRFGASELRESDRAVLYIIIIII